MVDAERNGVAVVLEDAAAFKVEGNGEDV